MSSSSHDFRESSCQGLKTALVLTTILAVSPVHSEQETIPDTAAGRCSPHGWKPSIVVTRLASAFTSRSASRRRSATRCCDGVPRENGWI